MVVIPVDNILDHLDENTKIFVAGKDIHVVLLQLSSCTSDSGKLVSATHSFEVLETFIVNSRHCGGGGGRCRRSLGGRGGGKEEGEGEERRRARPMMREDGLSARKVQ